MGACMCVGVCVAKGVVAMFFCNLSAVTHKMEQAVDVRREPNMGIFFFFFMK